MKIEQLKRLSKTESLTAFVLLGLGSLYLILTPSLLWIVFSFDLSLYDEKRIFQLAVLFLSTISILFSSGFRSSWLTVVDKFPAITRISLMLIFLGACLSAITAPLPRYSFLEVSFFFLLACYIIIFAALRKKLGKTMDEILLASIVISALFYLFLFFILYLGAHTGSFDEQGSNAIILFKAFPGFSNRRFFSQYQSWTLPLIVLPVVFFQLELRFSRILLWAIAMGWWTLLYASGTRGTVLAILTAVVIVLFVFRKNSIQWFLLQVKAATGGAVIYFVIFSLLPKVPPIIDKFARVSGSVRLKLWGQCLTLIATKPWLGVGPMHYAYQPNNYGIEFAHPHNSILQWAAEWGAPSALILVVLFAWGVLVWIRKCRTSMYFHGDQKNNMLLTALTVSLISGAVHSLVSGIIVMPLSQMTMVIILGWVIGIYHEEYEDAPVQTHYKNIFISLALLTALALLFYGIFPEIMNLKSYNKYFDEKYGIFHPRFWQQGYIFSDYSSFLNHAE